MSRVKAGVTRRRGHKRVLQKAKGYWGARHRWFKMASDTVMRAERYAWRDRRRRKRDFRRLWIARINAAARAAGLTYNRFMEGLSKAGVELNRKVLAELAVADEPGFQRLVEIAKGQLSASA